MKRIQIGVMGASIKVEVVSDPDEPNHDFKISVTNRTDGAFVQTTEVWGISKQELMELGTAIIAEASAMPE